MATAPTGLIRPNDRSFDSGGRNGAADGAADGRGLGRRLAIASAGAVLAAAFCYFLMVRTQLGQRFDNAAFFGARAQEGAQAAADVDQLRRITADSLALVLLILVAIGALRRRVLLGAGAAFAAGIAVVATHELRVHLLTRPAFGWGGYLQANTFPSGHTAAAVACAMALVLVSPPRWRGVAAVMAGAYGWITAAEVQTAGWHRPSDAIGGALLAFAAVTGVGAVLAWTRPVPSARREHHHMAQAILALVGLVDAAVVASDLRSVLRYLHAHALGVTLSGGMGYDAYIAGMAVTVEVVVVLLMILLALLGRFDLGGWGWGRRSLTRPERTE